MLTNADIHECAGAPDLLEARRIVEALAAVAGHLKPSDARLVQTWRSYLESAGDGAKVGKWRLEVLRRVAAEYESDIHENPARTCADVARA